MKMKKVSLIWAVLAALFLVGLSCSPAAVPATTPAATSASVELPGLLVDTDWLTDNLGRADLVVVDARSGSRYQDGHIPGAVNLATAEVTVNEPVQGMVAPPEQVEQVMGGLGISNDTVVVLYDDNRGLLASRIFWVLEYYGHEKVAMLDGGYPKWVAEGRDVTRVGTSVTPAEFRAVTNPSLFATKDYVLGNLGNPAVVFLDTRSPEEYTGEDVRAVRGGHIPGAVNVNWVESMTSGDVPVFKPIDELREMYASAGVTADKEAITYCQTAVRGAHSYFVLRMLGYEDIRVYDGSWVEWGNDDTLPVEK